MLIDFGPGGRPFSSAVQMATKPRQFEFDRDIQMLGGNHEGV
jgi:hypothetical protein